MQCPKNSQGGIHWDATAEHPLNDSTKSQKEADQWLREERENESTTRKELKTKPNDSIQLIESLRQNEGKLKAQLKTAEQEKKDTDVRCKKAERQLEECRHRHNDVQWK
ncbi:unnamed protein product [Soboliphyme baturini]|uniref:Remorin_C domain-containing protein n=1 Tax=Soboliphyme baturini TaxID=241478 RepID=A0A183J369_9BILA|nr:unnamed protein product [Soboliphyme baturini]